MVKLKLDCVVEPVLIPQHYQVSLLISPGTPEWEQLRIHCLWCSLLCVCRGKSNMEPPPSPSFCWTEVILGLTSLPWVSQFLNLPKNEWEFVYPRLIKPFVFILIYPLPREGDRAGGVLLPEGLGSFTPGTVLAGEEGVKEGWGSWAQQACLLEADGLISLTQVLTNCQRNGDDYVAGKAKKICMNNEKGS